MSHSEISIIAGGASAKRVDLAALPGTIFAVNDAAFHAPRVDVVVSMDRAWIQNRWRDLPQVPRFLRLSAMRNVFGLVRHPWTFAFECRYDSSEFGEYECTLNGNNSGQCALNLAYVRRPKRITLVGFDGGRGGHWFPAYPWGKPVADRPEWEAALQEGIRQCSSAGIEVVRL